MGKNRGSPLPTMGEDVTGTTFDAEETNEYGDEWLNRPYYQFQDEGYELTNMYEPIIDGVPRNLLQIKEIDWNKFMEDDPTGFFGEDGLETLSNIIKNPNYPDNILTKEMLIDSYNNKSYQELMEQVEDITNTIGRTREITSNF